MPSPGLEGQRRSLRDSLAPATSHPARGQTNTGYFEDKTGCSPILIARGSQANESKSVTVGGECRSVRVWPAGQQDSPHV